MTEPQVQAFKQTDGSGTVHVYVSGDRQCGKTRTMIDVVAGHVLAHGSPMIVVKTEAEGRHVQKLLEDRLRDLGVENPAAASKSVIRPYRHDRSHTYGVSGPFFFEDWGV